MDSKPARQSGKYLIAITLDAGASAPARRARTIRVRMKTDESKYARPVADIFDEI
jgi:hypothetical protein